VYSVECAYIVVPAGVLGVVLVGGVLQISIWLALGRGRKRKKGGKES
jgi:hypothetical protein